MNALARLLDSDVAYSFRQSPVAIGATLVAFLMALALIGAVGSDPREQNPAELKTENQPEPSPKDVSPVLVGTAAVQP